jgi:hypothetical protein
MNKARQESVSSQPSSTAFSPTSSVVSSPPSVYLTALGQATPGSSTSGTPWLSKVPSASRVSFDPQSESDSAETTVVSKKKIPGERERTLPDIEPYPIGRSGSASLSARNAERSARRPKLSEFDIPPPRTYLSGVDAMSPYLSQVRAR